MKPWEYYRGTHIATPTVFEHCQFYFYRYGKTLDISLELDISNLPTSLFLTRKNFPELSELFVRNLRHLNIVHQIHFDLISYDIKIAEYRNKLQQLEQEFKHDLFEYFKFQPTNIIAEKIYAQLDFSSFEQRFDQFESKYLEYIEQVT